MLRNSTLGYGIRRAYLDSMERLAAKETSLYRDWIDAQAQFKGIAKQRPLAGRSPNGEVLGQHFQDQESG